MSQYGKFEHEASESTLTANLNALSQNEYPGRVIVMGRLATGNLVQLYALMGRRDSSRNRVFSEDFDAVRTVAPGMSVAEMSQVENADLIYYKAMVSTDTAHVVSNGAQTQPIMDGTMQYLDLFNASLQAGTVKTAGKETDLSSFEPDESYTPRISGIIDFDQHAPTPFGLTIVSKDLETGEPVRRAWTEYKLSNLTAGVGHCIHTYKENGDPLPSFDSAPYPIPLAGTGVGAAKELWSTLNESNRVAVVAKEIRADGTVDLDSVTIINRHQL